MSQPVPVPMPMPMVFVIDDDASIRGDLTRLLRSAGFTVGAFPSARRFLARPPHDGPSCMVVDLCVPGMSGLELQAELARGGRPMPVIFLSGHADVASAVKAMKAGAVDFLVKPCDDRELLDAIERAIARDVSTRRERRECDAVRARLEALTPRELQVCDLVAKGLLNKQVAWELGTSEKTIKVHRGRVMEKLGVGSVAELVRLVDRARRD